MNEVKISNKEWEETLRALFEGCRQQGGDRFPNALIPIYSDRPVGFFSHQMNEVFDFALTLRRFIQLIDQGHWPYDADKEMSIRLSMVSYCHIMEADLPYLILLNLCRVSENLDADWLFWPRNDDDSLILDDKGKARPVSNVGEKNGHIKKYKLAQKTGVTELLCKLWNNQLRNAFSHSQYVVDTEGAFTYFSYGKTPREQARDDKTVKSLFERVPYEAVKGLYEEACVYIDVFGEVYGEFVAPYKEMESVALGVGKVRYDKEAGLWRLLIAAKTTNS